MFQHPLRRCALFCTFLLVIMLVGCGDETPATRTSQAPLATPRLVVTQPVADVSGEQLSGRLLFVRDGVVWLWQGDHAQPFFGDGQTIQPAWSRDGSKLAYIQRDNSFSDLMLADDHGVLVTLLTNNGANAGLSSFDRVRQTTWALYPSWSPDGTKILYAGQYSPPTGDPAAEFNLSLFQTGLQSGAGAQLFADDEAHCGRSLFLSDGSIIYVRQASTQNGEQQIYRFAPGDTAGQPLAGIPEGSYDPTLSADGSLLAFAMRSNNQTDIWLVPATGAGDQQPRRLTSVGTARAPAFSPDGKLLAFLAIPPDGSSFELWVSDFTRDEAGNLTAGQPRQLTKDLKLDADSGLSWAP